MPAIPLLCEGESEVGDRATLDCRKVLLRILSHLLVSGQSQADFVSLSNMVCQVVSPSRTRVQEPLTLPELWAHHPHCIKDLFLRSHNAKKDIG